MFTADAFGKFGTYDSHPDDWATEARRYYVNICGKYGPQVGKALDKVEKFDVRLICSLHGRVLEGENCRGFAPVPHLVALRGGNAGRGGSLCQCARRHEERRHAAWRKSSARRARPKWCSTTWRAAASTTLWPTPSAMAHSSWRLRAMTPTCSPPMHFFLHKLGLKGYRNRRVGIIENASWAATAARTMKAQMEKWKGIELLEPIVTVKSALHTTDVPALEALADAALA